MKIRKHHILYLLFMCIIIMYTYAHGEGKKISQEKLIKQALEDYLEDSKFKKYRAEIKSRSNYFVKKTPTLWYQKAYFNLNEDYKKEIILYLQGPLVCGTGGCNTLIFTQEDNLSLRLIGDIPTSKLPIHAAITSSQGFKDIIVRIGEGGKDEAFSKNTHARFNGSTYIKEDPSLKKNDLLPESILLIDENTPKTVLLYNK